MKYLLAPVVLGLYCSLAAADCTQKPGELAATYQVTSKGADNGETRYNMTLWRQQSRVAHQYPERQVTQIWEQASNGTLRLERHFDEFEKGIEYQPLDINHGRGEKDWSLKYQLISDQMMARMALVEAGNGDCDGTEIYRLSGEQEFELTWLPGQQLVESFQVRSPSATTTWTLTAIDTDKAAVENFFSRHSAYQMTDYADIGDNEADPFIRRMINLGFIDHGASGFYDDKGNPAVHHH